MDKRPTGKWRRWPSPKAAGNLGDALCSACVQLQFLTIAGWPVLSPSSTELLQRPFLTPLSRLCHHFLFFFFPKLKCMVLLLSPFIPDFFPPDSGFLVEDQRPGCQSASTCRRFNCTNQEVFCRRIKCKYSPSHPVLPFICSAEF